MKKLLALILTIGMIFTLASCGGDKTESGGKQASGAKKIDYANMTEDDLIKEFIKDEQNITLDEFINLVSTYSYATINDKLELDENITNKAIKKLKDNKAALPAATTSGGSGTIGAFPTRMTRLRPCAICWFPLFRS